ncbi:MAG: MBL fold metallo-hydrolase [Candidatus Woesearchaeota archaeon]
MDDGLFFLGTAGDAIVASKQFASSAGMLYKYGDTMFLLDPGPGSLVRAKQYEVNLRELTAVFLSTPDWIHSNDVNAVISAMTYEGLDPRGLLVLSKDALAQGNDSLQIVSPMHRAFVERTLALDTGARIGINNIDVHSIGLEKSNGIGYVFDAPEHTTAYIPHTSFSEELAKNLRGVGTLILHLRNRTREEAGFLNIPQAIDLLKIAQPKRCILTGYGMKVLEHDPMDIARQIHKATGIEVIAPKDGLYIPHLKTKGQKTLGSF